MSSILTRRRFLQGFGAAAIAGAGIGNGLAATETLRTAQTGARQRVWDWQDAPGYKAACLAHPDCLAFWGLDGPAGASRAQDSGPNGVHLPRIGSPAFGEPGFVAGLDKSARFVGAQAFGIDAPSHPIFDRSEALTLCGWVKIDGPASAQMAQGWNHLFGRTKLWNCAVASSGQVGVRQDTTGMPGNIFAGTQSDATHGRAYESGDVLFLALSWSLDVGWLQNILNGVLHAQIIRDIPFPALVKDKFLIGCGDAGRDANLRISGVALFGSQLSTGELRVLRDKNASFASLGNGSLDPPNPDKMPGAGLLGTHLTLGGPRVEWGGKVYRPEQYEAMGLGGGPQRLPVAKGHVERLPYLAAGLAYEQIATQTQRSTLRGDEGKTYFDGTVLRSNQSGPTLDGSRINAICMTMLGGIAALNHWALRGKPTEDSELARLASAMMEQILANTDASGLPFPPQSDGLPSQLWSDTVPACLLLKPYVPKAKFDAWVAMLHKAANRLWEKESGFHINGNQLMSQCVVYYGMHLLTREQIWLDRYHAQWQATLYPTDAILSSQGPARTAGFGLFKLPDHSRVTDLMTLNAAADQAYLAESSNIGAGSRTGVDWDYLQLTLVMTWRLYCLTKGEEQRRLFDVMFNAFWARVKDPHSNSAPWTYDARGGTRRSAIVDPLFTTLPEIMAVSGLRSDFKPDLSTHWMSSVVPTYRHDQHGNGLNLYRDLGTNLGGILMASPQWPGMPV